MRGTRRRAVLVAALVGALAWVLVPIGAASAGVAPPDIPLTWYRTGLEPGSTLGGHALPRVWANRTSPCDPDAAPQRSAVRVATTDSTAVPSLYPAPPDPDPDLLEQYPGLCPGDESEAVERLQELLTEKMLYREEINGVYDDATRYAVIAFHKLIGPAHDDPRTARKDWIADPPPEDWSHEDWLMLEAFSPRPPKVRIDQPDRVEVDLGHQVMYLIENDQVAAIMPVSSGKGSGTRACYSVGCNRSVTPRTDQLEGGSSFYTAHGYYNGWSPRPGAWSIYKAVFYRGNYREWNYAIHGYRRVPSYPASHGCIRVTVWDMDFLRPSIEVDAPDMRIYVGMSIHVWDA